MKGKKIKFRKFLGQRAIRLGVNIVILLIELARLIAGILTSNALSHIILVGVILITIIHMFFDKIWSWILQVLCFVGYMIALWWGIISEFANLGVKYSINEFLFFVIVAIIFTILLIFTIVILMPKSTAYRNG